MERQQTFDQMQLKWQSFAIFIARLLLSMRQNANRTKHHQRYD
jgi:hypothetical protein